MRLDPVKDASRVLAALRPRVGPNGTVRLALPILPQITGLPQQRLGPAISAAIKGHELTIEPADEGFAFYSLQPPTRNEQP
jgi:hypothetical protein